MSSFCDTVRITYRSAAGQVVIVEESTVSLASLVLGCVFPFGIGSWGGAAVLDEVWMVSGGS